jgi:hypothetical protein
LTPLLLHTIQTFKKCFSIEKEPHHSYEGGRSFIHTGVDLKRAHPTIEASSVIRKRGLISTLPRLPTI